jgi:hypothetical protein
MVYKPDAFFTSIDKIPFSLFDLWQIQGLILDVDNTLLPRTSYQISPEIRDWVREAKKRYNVLIVSNNTVRKIRRAADPLDLPFIAWTIKPFSLYFHKAYRKLGLIPEKVCVIGDQLFTDIQGAKRTNAKAIYVSPLAPEDDLPWTKWRRKHESKILAEWSKTEQLFDT